MKLCFVITNDKVSFVAKGDNICLFSVAKETAFNEQRIKPCVTLVLALIKNSGICRRKKVETHNGNKVLLDSKDQRNSEQKNTLSFCPRSCCFNLKNPQSGINTRMYVCASPVGDEDAGGAGGPDGAGGAGSVCRRDI